MKVVHCKRAPFDIYIGRPKVGHPWQWGNPFEIGKDGNRTEVIRRFREWITKGETFNCSAATLQRRAWMRANLHTLRGKVLGCWCAPTACHGDVLIELLNQIEGNH